MRSFIPLMFQIVFLIMAGVALHQHSEAMYVMDFTILSSVWGAASWIAGSK